MSSVTSTPGAGPFFVIVRARARALRGFLRRHAFEILILGPIILGGAVWASRRLLGDLSEPLRHATLQALATGENPLAIVGLIFALLVTSIQLPATGRELFRPSALGDALDATPTPDRTRLASALVALTGRNTPPCLGLLLVLPVLGPALGPSDLAAATVAGLVTALLLALAQIPLALVLTRGDWLTPGGLRGRGLAAVAGLVGVVLLALLLIPGGRWALLPWWAAAAGVEDLLRRALGAPALSPIPWLAGVLATIVGLGTAGLLLFDRWWRPLRERLATSPQAAPTTTHIAERLGFDRWLPTDLVRRTLLVRDLRLIRRKFSIAVPVSTTLAASILATVALVLFGDRLPPDWERRTVVLAAAVVAAARVALVPLLLAHQLPRLWMEKGSGIEPQEMVAAKTWTARWLVTPWLLAATGLAFAANLSPTLRWMTAGQALVAGGMMASIVALSVWEVADQPVLGLIFGSLLGLALAALMAFYPRAWWLWLVFYFFLAGQLAGRAGRRVRFTEVPK